MKLFELPEPPRRPTREDNTVRKRTIGWDELYSHRPDLLEVAQRQRRTQSAIPELIKKDSRAGS